MQQGDDYGDLSTTEEEDEKKELWPQKLLRELEEEEKEKEQLSGMGSRSASKKQPQPMEKEQHPQPTPLQQGGAEGDLMRAVVQEDETRAQQEEQQQPSSSSSPVKQKKKRAPREPVVLGTSIVELKDLTDINQALRENNKIQEYRLQLHSILLMNNDEITRSFARDLLNNGLFQASPIVRTWFERRLFGEGLRFYMQRLRVTLATERDLKWQTKIELQPHTYNIFDTFKSGTWKIFRVVDTRPGQMIALCSKKRADDGGKLYLIPISFSSSSTGGPPQFTLLSKRAKEIVALDGSQGYYEGTPITGDSSAAFEFNDTLKAMISARDLYLAQEKPTAKRLLLYSREMSPKLAKEKTETKIILFEVLQERALPNLPSPTLLVIRGQRKRSSPMPEFNAVDVNSENLIVFKGATDVGAFALNFYGYERSDDIGGGSGYFPISGIKSNNEFEAINEMKKFRDNQFVFSLSEELLVTCEHEAPFTLRFVSVKDQRLKYLYDEPVHFTEKNDFVAVAIAHFGRLVAILFRGKIENLKMKLAFVYYENEKSHYVVHDLTEAPAGAQVVQHASMSFDTRYVLIAPGYDAKVAYAVDVAAVAFPEAASELGPPPASVPQAQPEAAEQSAQPPPAAAAAQSSTPQKKKQKKERKKPTPEELEDLEKQQLRLGVRVEQVSTETHFKMNIPGAGMNNRELLIEPVDDQNVLITYDELQLDVHQGFLLDKHTSNENRFTTALVRVNEEDGGLFELIEQWVYEGIRRDIEEKTIEVVMQAIKEDQLDIELQNLNAPDASGKVGDEDDDEGDDEGAAKGFEVRGGQFREFGEEEEGEAELDEEGRPVPRGLTEEQLVEYKKFLQETHGSKLARKSGKEIEESLRRRGGGM